MLSASAGVARIKAESETDTEYLAALEDITPKFAQQKSFWRTDPCAACRPMLIDFCPLVPLIALYFDS
jgi:hypothetical protein